MVAIRDVARLAAAQGAPTSEITARLAQLPSPLSGRLTASHLTEAIDTEADAALTLVTEEVARHDPMPETLRLLRELGVRELPGLEERMLRALGDPPSNKEVETLGEGETLPRAWIHAWSWLIAMPAAVDEVWSAANDLVQGRWGEASPNGGVWPGPSIVDVPKRVAGEAVELAALGPLDAAGRIASWEPDITLPGDGRYSAGLALHGLASDQPARWLAQEQIPLLEALRDPVLVERYLRALADRSEQIQEHVPAVLDAVEFAEGKLDLQIKSGEPGATGWKNAVSAGIELIGKLAADGARFDGEIDRGWSLIERAARRRDEPLRLEEEAE